MNNKKNDKNRPLKDLIYSKIFFFWAFHIFFDIINKVFVSFMMYTNHNYLLIIFIMPT